MPAGYTARIVDVPAAASVPDQPNDADLLAIGRAAPRMFTCTVRCLPASTPQAGPGGL
jgi:hypothetical protein